MRLRTRLALLFSLLAVVPLVLVLPLAVRNVRTTLSGELEQRIVGALAAAEAVLDGRRRDAQAALTELAQSEAMAEVVQDLEEGAPPARLARVAERLMESRSLTVLSLFDARGRTISSGHLPARVGDPDPLLYALTRETDPKPRPALVELRSERGVRQHPALVTARRASGTGPLRVWLVGGVLLDQALAEQLARVSGARVEIEAHGQLVVSAGEVASPQTTRELPLSDEVRVVFRFSRAGLVSVQRGLLQAVAVLAAVGLLFAILLGLIAARRITRPVEALTEGARKVATGQLDFQVEDRATGELAELIATFNRMTSELRRTTEQLLASERIAAWQEVAKRLAHEIKNPLTPIKMSLETLVAAKQEHHPLFPKLFEESAGAVLEEVERLRRIVDEFSRFARLPKPKLEPVDLTALTEGVLALHASPPAGILLRPELHPAVRALVDRDQLTQVLVNLVKNAEEALPGGGEIFVRVKQPSGAAVIEVEDTGPGFPAEAAAHVFEPYFTTKESGTGLGLSIAARICQDHGGKLELDQRPGRGALFRITLPAHPG